MTIPVLSETAIRQQATAESFQRGQRYYYDHHAVNWLEKARAAYRTAGCEAEWPAYLQELRTRHQRKYKLMAMLEAL
jgi:uncharacterized Zn finger protein